MNFIDLFLEIFSIPEDHKPVVSRPKFVEGTQWTCPVCGEVLTTAKRDIYQGEARSAYAWEGMLANSVMPVYHCGVATMRYNSLGQTEIHTPTGWVGERLTPRDVTPLCVGSIPTRHP